MIFGREIRVGCGNIEYELDKRNEGFWILL